MTSCARECEAQSALKGRNSERLSTKEFLKENETRQKREGQKTKGKRFG
jgi:hypothetical protein